jgi:hypothetical protein
MTTVDYAVDTQIRVVVQFDFSARTGMKEPLIHADCRRADPR